MSNPPPAPEDRNITEAPDARRRAAVAGHTGDEVAARAVLDHADGGVRATALHALARMGSITAADVERALRDPDAEVRRRALADAIGTAVDLRPLLRDPVAVVVEQAAWALGEREDPAAVDALLDVVAHRDPLVREAVVAALGAIQDERGLPAILRATEDRPAIRRRAVLALAAFDGEDVDAALLRAKDDKDWQVRDAADVILRARGAAT